MNAPVDALRAQTYDMNDRRPCFIPDTLVAVPDAAIRRGSFPDRFEATSRDDFPVVAALNYLFNHAAENGYSDIHFETAEAGLLVRYRELGVLNQWVVFDAAVSDDLERIMRARAQVRDRDDVAPRDGTFWFRADTKTVDVRINFLATRAGKTIVCRLLDQSNATRPLSSIQMTDLQRTLFHDALFASEGLILTVGPTGSGKTSTLYSCLNERNTPDVKILTVEDPVEYTLPGAQQVNVARPSRTFATVVRAALRQDIDIALVGEIRDSETASAAMDVANTGHLVMSTLHSNSATSAVTRLLSGLGADPFALAAALRLIVGQRLIRKLCSDCKRIEALTQAQQDALSARGYVSAANDGQPTEFAAHKNQGGCLSCQGRGTRGIRPILELVVADKAMRDAIESNEGAKALRSIASLQPTYRPLNSAAIDASTTTFDVDFTEAMSCAASAD